MSIYSLGILSGIIPTLLGLKMLYQKNKAGVTLILIGSLCAAVFCYYNYEYQTGISTQVAASYENIK